VKYLKLFENKEIDWVFDEEEFPFSKKDEYIKYIKEKVDKYGILSMGELESDYSPVYKHYYNEIHTIEQLHYSNVEVVVYGGYKQQEYIDEYQENYEVLSISTLIEIKGFIENDIDFEI